MNDRRRAHQCSFEAYETHDFQASPVVRLSYGGASVTYDSKELTVRLCGKGKAPVFMGLLDTVVALDHSLLAPFRSSVMTASCQESVAAVTIFKLEHSVVCSTRWTGPANIWWPSYAYMDILAKKCVCLVVAAAEKKGVMKMARMAWNLSNIRFVEMLGALRRVAMESERASRRCMLVAENIMGEAQAFDETVVMAAVFLRTACLDVQSKERTTVYRDIRVQTANWVYKALAGAGKDARDGKGPRSCQLSTQCAYHTFFDKEDATKLCLIEIHYSMCQLYVDVGKWEAVIKTPRYDDLRSHDMVASVSICLGMLDVSVALDPPLPMELTTPAGHAAFDMWTLTSGHDVKVWKAPVMPFPCHSPRQFADVFEREYRCGQAFSPIYRAMCFTYGVNGWETAMLNDTVKELARRTLADPTQRQYLHIGRQMWREFTAQGTVHPTVAQTLKFLFEVANGRLVQKHRDQKPKKKNTKNKNKKTVTLVSVRKEPECVQFSPPPPPLVIRSTAKETETCPWCVKSLEQDGAHFHLVCSEGCDIKVHTTCFAKREVVWDGKRVRGSGVRWKCVPNTCPCLVCGKGALQYAACEGTGGIPRVYVNSTTEKKKKKVKAMKKN